MIRKRHPCAPLVVTIALFGGCRGGQLPEVVDVREVSSAHGGPKIESIVDLGARGLPRRGRLVASHRDGSAVIGELLLVEGSGFGKQPTVSVGGRAAAVLARVEGGGLVVRVPWGIDPGQVEVEVSTAGGRHGRAFSIRRVGLVATGRGLWPLLVAADGKVTAGQQLSLPGAEKLELSSDGAAAYVAGVSQGPRLRILDLAAPQPLVVSERALQGARVLDLCTAEQAPVGAVLTDTHVQLFETVEPLEPAIYNPLPLPAPLRDRRVLAAALGGQGRLLALLLAELNQVAVLDVTNPRHPGAPVLVDVLPGNPLSLVQDLRFSADEGSLWVVSGDGPRSIGGGFQPLRVTLIQVQRTATGAPRLSVHRTWELGEKEAPRQMAVAHGEPIPPGTVIRPEPSASAVYIATIPTHWLKPGVGRAPGGAVLRTALSGGTHRLLGGARLVTSIDVVGKTQILLGLAAEARGANGLRRVLLSQRAWEAERPHLLELDSVETAGSPPWLGEVRAQP